MLYDLGYVSTPEPFQRLFNQGYILAAAYTDERGMHVEAEEVEERDGEFFFEGQGVTREFGKMLKPAPAPGSKGDRKLTPGEVDDWMKWFQEPK